MNYDHYFLMIDESQMDFFEELFEINDFQNYYIQNDLESKIVSLNIYVEENTKIPDFLEKYEFIRGETGNLELWQKKWKESLSEFALCDYISIVPLQRKEKITEKNKIGLIPGFLFGTGLHESTKIASVFLRENLKNGDDVLDVGCGTGILSVLSKKLGADFVLGLDNERDAWEKIEEISWINGVDFNFRESDFLSNVEKEEKFDIIVSNMIFELIKKFVLDLTGYLKKDGKVIIAGLLEAQSEEFEDYIKNIYSILERKVENEWIGYLLTIKN